MLDAKTKEIIGVYGLLLASIICGFVPMIIFAVFAAIFFSLALFVAGQKRRKSYIDNDILLTSHMTYIIRTVWISSFIGLITVTIASIYVLKTYDPGPVSICLNDMMTGAATQDLEACFTNFAHANMGIFIRGTIIAAVPLVLYLALRLVHGIKDACAKKPIANPKTWL